MFISVPMDIYDPKDKEIIRNVILRYFNYSQNHIYQPLLMEIFKANAAMNIFDISDMSMIFSVDKKSLQLCEDITVFNTLISNPLFLLYRCQDYMTILTSFHNYPLTGKEFFTILRKWPTDGLFEYLLSRPNSYYTDDDHKHINKVKLLGLENSNLYSDRL